MADIKTNLHDLNKMVVGQLPELNKKGIEELASDIRTLERKKEKYFMLLSNEKKDYTIFNKVKEKGSLDLEVLDVISTRGKIKEYEVMGDYDAIEIWVDETFYALFPYDLGVVEY